MQKYRTFLTKKGREKIVAAEAAGTHLALLHVAVGDALDPPTEDLTALRKEVWRGEVNRIQVDAKDAHVLNVEAVIPAQDGGFMVRELGLFDTEGDLIAVGRAPDSYKPLVEDGAAKSLLIVFKIIIDNTAVVALSVDDSVVLVTREYLAQQLSLHTTNKDNPHGVTKSQVGLGSVSNYAVATEAEAKEGTSNTKYMTPLRTNQLVGQIAGETAGGVQTNLNEHIANDRNPHNVTKAQVGLSNVDNVKQATKTEFDIHTADKTNPHGVTKSQVGLASVLNYGVATQTEAEAGTSNSKYMTPLSTKQAIIKQAATLVTTHVDDKANPHNVTKAQVGLAKVLDYELATEADAEGGTSHQKYMTPLRTKQAITKQTTAHFTDKVQHITADERNSWNAKETPEGAQAKANEVLRQAKNYASQVGENVLRDAKTYTQESASTLDLSNNPQMQSVQELAKQAFQAGNNVKVDAVGALLSVDSGLGISTNSSWGQITTAINKLKGRKKFAMGSGTQDFYADNFLNMSGLSFKPSFIAVKADGSTYTYHYVSAYASLPNGDVSVAASSSSNPGSADCSTGYGYFKIRVRTGNRTAKYEWVAYE